MKEFLDEVSLGPVPIRSFTWEAKYIVPVRMYVEL
jgi:hypothetical protein